MEFQKTHQEDQEKLKNVTEKGQFIELSHFSLSDYILQNQIGYGAFGKVFKVREKKTKKIYAAKISIHSINEISKDTLKALISEVNIISKLHHPSILEYVGYSSTNFKNKAKPVIITEYVSNGSLHDLIEFERTSKTNNKFDSTQKLICIYGIASAMSYLHLHDIIHRDLKPENILIDSFMFPKIADFGLSKIKQTQQDKSNACIKGTPIYISPEIWRKYEYTKAGDVYAFGFICYEIITNERPFEEVSIFQIMLNVLEGYRPQFKKPIPPPYRQLIESCWSEEPKERPSFLEITKRLKEDKRFITDSVDEEKFLKYVKFIDESEVSFDSAEDIVNKDDFFKAFKQTNNNVENSDNERINIILDSSQKVKNCPLKYFLSLNKDCQKQIEEAENDQSKLFLLAEHLIEGKHPFEQNIEIGFKYLKIAVKSGNIDASIYYFMILIKGEIIPPNFKRARKILENIIKEDKSTYFYLKGKLLSKEGKFEEALESFKNSIELGNKESIYEYGKHLLKGKGKTINKEEGLKYIKESAEQGSIRSMYRYGKLLIEEGENDKGIEFIKKAAECGDAKSLYLYSKLIEKSDKEKSNEYLKSSAYKGYTEAMYLYAFKLPDEPQYRDENILFYKKAGNKGHIESLYQYALYLSDNNDEESEKKVAKLTRIAANNGNPDAMNFYAYCLFKGKGVECDREEATKYMKKSADKGNEKGIFNYGNCLLKGEGTQVNIQEAVKYLKISIEKGNTTAMNLYAKILFEGKNNEVNKEEAAKLYKMSADKGDTTGMVNYALILLKGEGVKCNKEEGFKYINKIIEKGEEGVANNIYGFIYYEGIGVEVNKKEAIKYYKKAADKGITEAMIKYANMLYMGDGIEPNKEEAFNYLKNEANKGNKYAMNKYAQCALFNQSDINLDEALKYYKMAADNQDTEGLFNYGLLLLFGKNPQRQIKFLRLMKERIIRKYSTEMTDNIIASLFMETFNDDKAEIDPEALKYLEKSASYGHTTAMRLLAIIYSNRSSIKNRGILAAKYYKMAADNGDIDSIGDYALMSFNGDLIPENIDECLKYFKMGIEKGDPRSAYNYGIIHYEGKKVPKDESIGIKYLKIASDLGHLNSTKILARIYIENKNEEEAFKYIKIAADKGDVFSIYDLANFLENGIGTQVNKDAALKYYKIAVFNGYDSSILNYAVLLYTGYGNESDRAELLKYLEILSINNEGKFYYQIANKLIFEEEFPTAKQEAFKFYKLAIERGNSSAMCEYAYFLQVGDGIPVNFEEAIKYNKMAIDKGDGTAMNNYACMLEKGEGVPVNKEEAIKFYKMAIDKGIPASMYHYGKMLHYGDGIECNKEEAINYYLMAIEKGENRAEEELEKLLAEID